jgi:hypothetical protein
MKITALKLSLATLVLGAAAIAASSYDVKLYAPVSIGATNLKAGDYKVEMQGDKAVFKSGKNVIEVPATMGTSDQKFGFTSLLTTDSKLREIDLGGTKSKIVFNQEGQSASSAKAEVKAEGSR